MLRARHARPAKETSHREAVTAATRVALRKGACRTPEFETGLTAAITNQRDATTWHPLSPADRVGSASYKWEARGMPSITGQIEVNLTVSDPRRSAAWYSDLLG